MDLSEGSAAIGAILSRLGLPAVLLSPLLAHASAVARDSPRLGLVSTGDERHVLRRHTADSLTIALARPPRVGERWVDMGSGGGFPGLVLAICYPQAGFTLVEAQGRKAGFLDMQALDLGLANVAVIADRIERVESGFDVAVARAVTEPARALALLRPLLREGGAAMVLGAGAVPGAEVVRVELPEVDSPGLVFMMTRTGGEPS